MEHTGKPDFVDSICGQSGRFPKPCEHYTPGPIEHNGKEITKSCALLKAGEIEKVVWSGRCGIVKGLDRSIQKNLQNLGFKHPDLLRTTVVEEPDRINVEAGARDVHKEMTSSSAKGSMALPSKRVRKGDVDFTDNILTEVLGNVVGALAGNPLVTPTMPALWNYLKRSAYSQAKKVLVQESGGKKQCGSCDHFRLDRTREKGGDQYCTRAEYDDGNGKTISNPLYGKKRVVKDEACPGFEYRNLFPEHLDDSIIKRREGEEALFEHGGISEYSASSAKRWPLFAVRFERERDVNWAFKRVIEQWVEEAMNNPREHRERMRCDRVYREWEKAILDPELDEKEIRSRVKALQKRLMFRSESQIGQALERVLSVLRKKLPEYRVYEPRVTVEKGAIRKGEPIRVRWSGFDGKVNVKMTDGEIWLEIAMSQGRSGNLDIPSDEFVAPKIYRLAIEQIRRPGDDGRKKTIYVESDAFTLFVE